MKKLGALFYIILLILTAAVLVLLALWLRTENYLFFFLMLAAFAAYLFHLIFHLAKIGKSNRKQKDLEKNLLSLLESSLSAVVYITYLGPLKRVRTPSKTKPDFLVEFYTKDVDCEKLKRHLWFDLSIEDETLLKQRLIGGLSIPYPLLARFTHKKIFIQRAFLEEAQNSPSFSNFLSQNEFIPYGEEHD